MNLLDALLDHIKVRYVQEWRSVEECRRRYWGLIDDYNNAVERKDRRVIKMSIADIEHYYRIAKSELGLRIIDELELTHFKKE